MRVYAIAAVLLLLLAACAPHPGTPVPAGSIPVALGKAVSLHVNESAFVPSENLKIYFRGVTADSRCAVDVQCIWAGQANLTFVVLQNSEVLGKYGAIIGANPQDVTFRKYTLHVESLAPEPLSTRPIASGDYVATIVVSKNS